MADIASLLSDFGKQIGLGELAFDSGGACALRFDDQYDVTLTHDRDGQALFLCGSAGPAPAETGEAAWRRLLAASCLGAETGGCGLGLAEDGAGLVLWKRHDDGAFADLADFEKAVNRFLGSLIGFRQRLRELLSAADSPSRTGVSYGADLRV